MAFDPISVVEASYELGSSDEDWLGRLCDDLREFIGGESLYTAYLFERASGEGVGLRQLVAPGADEELRANVKALNASIPPSLADIVLAPGRLALSSLRTQLEQAGVPAEAIGGAMQLPGLEGEFDFKGLLAHDGVRRGAVFVTAVPGRATLSAPQVDLAERVAAHIGAAIRLRQRVGHAWGPDHPDVEAIFDPGGRCRHAQRGATAGAARELLGRSVKGMDRARSSLRRRSPDEALGLWQGLVDGRWSLVESFDTDGSRFLLACRNMLELPDPRALSERERQVARYVSLGMANKRIAYRLGISQSAVSQHLKQILRKLRLDSAEALAVLAEPASNLAVEAHHFSLAGEPFGGLKIEPGALVAHPALTEAEREVARYAIEGHSNAQIAQLRSTSDRTVANQLTSIFRKLGVASRREMIHVLRLATEPPHDP